MIVTQLPRTVARIAMSIQPSSHHIADSWTKLYCECVTTAMRWLLRRDSRVRLCRRCAYPIDASRPRTHPSVMIHFPSYCSAVTCSIHSTALPFCFSWMAMCVMAVFGERAMPCFSPGGNQTTSPGPISSTGPPQRCTRPTGGDDERLSEGMRVPGRASAGLERDGAPADYGAAPAPRKRIDAHRFP